MDMPVIAVFVVVSVALVDVVSRYLSVRATLESNTPATNS